jgi:hypothetical protein
MSRIVILNKYTYLTFDLMNMLQKTNTIIHFLVIVANETAFSRPHTTIYLIEYQFYML